MAPLYRNDPEADRSEEHTSEPQSPCNLVCRLLLEKKKKKTKPEQHLARINRDRHMRHRTTLLLRSLPSLLLPVSLCVRFCICLFFFFFFFNDTATTEIYTLSLHDALPI